ncbi:MAG: RNA polymerase sigma factor [Alphaproteobacteria bacterium]|nr:RNA polymerase sigma factor [Alphaproteobacteria bacterium]
MTANPLQDTLQDQLIQHIPDLRRFARSLERNRVAADDLVQETLERAIKKMHLYEPSGPFIGWLNTIMRNIFVDRVRRRKINASTSLEDAPRNEPYQNENQVDRLVLKELRVAIDRLPTEQRQVLLMIALQGLSYEDAAQRLGVPLGTIRSRLFRARANLQSKIDPEGRLAEVKRPHGRQAERPTTGQADLH